MRWKKANQNKRRDGSRFPKADFRLFVLCNRFAASVDGRMLMGERWSSPRYKDWFYALKDRLMDRFGKPCGLALQYWTSYAYDYHDDYGFKDGAHHYHILERVSLCGRIFHRPTGHFSYSNDVTEYYKETAGFDLVKVQCVEKLIGKKEITRNIPSSLEAVNALMKLRSKYAQLLQEPTKEREQPRIIKGNHQDYVREQGVMREAHGVGDSGHPRQCHFCLQDRLSMALARYDGHDICLDCASKIIKLGARQEEVPF